MIRPAMWMLVRHEVRALWLVWAASAAVCLAARVVNQPRWLLPSYLAYFVGSVALAALAIGHEYTHGTLPALLSLPVDRRRLLSAKLLTLLPMLVTLAPLALAISPDTQPSGRGTVDVALSLLTAVSVAPWLTMLCRSPLAGTVFAVGLAGGLHLVSLGALIAYVKLAGLPGLPLQVFGDRILAGLLIASAAAGAIGGWRRFMTLEAIDGRGAEVTWPLWLRSTMVLDEAAHVMPAQRFSPLWLLVTKELRLQQMSIAVVAINVAIWLASLFVVGRSAESDEVLASLAVLYGALVAMLIGALASAEERHLGTLTWQMLLPVAAWQQFAVKTLVALTLSLLLAFALPLLLARGELVVNWASAASMLFLTLGSLLVSSLCNNGLKAMIVAATLMFVVGTLLVWSGSLVHVGSNEAVLLIAAVAGPMWWVAFVNHRTVRS